MGRKEPENPVAGSSSDEINHEAFDAYEEELAWCIHRLKLSMNAKNLTPRQGGSILIQFYSNDDNYFLSCCVLS